MLNKLIEFLLIYMYFFYMSEIYSLEVCAGAGGQALGLERAGFNHLALVEIDNACCNTLRANMPSIEVIEDDLKNIDLSNFHNIDLFSGGLPCPPFSVAGKQLGSKDERNLFPAAISIIDEIRPKAIMIENVRGILNPIFSSYLEFIFMQLKNMNYVVGHKLLNASNFGVPQIRQRVIIVAIQKDISDSFIWPENYLVEPPTVGDVLFDLMASNGWAGAEEWKYKANSVAPTLVGGSKKHGGPDLGPTRARKAWLELGVDGNGIADKPPDADFVGFPRLTVEMCARLQGFPDTWKFIGKKTAAYRQIGNALPPQIANAVGSQIIKAINRKKIWAVV